jgi:ribosomal protein S18 acetylase RimI-like enzyme
VRATRLKRKPLDRPDPRHQRHPTLSPRALERTLPHAGSLDPTHQSGDGSRNAMSTPGAGARHGTTTVRRLEPGDTDLFRIVRLAALEDRPDAFGETLEEARHSDWSARVASGSSFTDRGVFVAVAGERAVGMVSVRAQEPRSPAFLGGMWVHPAVRRQGTGRALVVQGLDFLRSIGQAQVVLWVTEGHSDVLGFYRGLGFRVT